MCITGFTRHHSLVVLVRKVIMVAQVMVVASSSV